MAKLQIIDANGNKSKEISTEIFSSEIRPDIVQKIAEIERFSEKQPNAPYLWSGMQTSASGNVKHNRHVWKTDRGRGTSRYPKKRMSDKGSHFVWVAAAIPGVRGGRRAHPPKVLRADSKINKKEMLFALKAALAMSASAEEIKKKYSSLGNAELKIKLPIIVDSKITNLKAKQFFSFLEKALGENLSQIAVPQKSIRAGAGKMRGRKYKQNAGMIIVFGNKENAKISGVASVKAGNLKIRDLVENGARLAMFTEEAVKDLENKLAGKKKAEVKK